MCAIQLDIGSFATNSILLIPKSMQPVGVDLWYSKLRLFDVTEFIFYNSPLPAIITAFWLFSPKYFYYSCKLICILLNSRKLFNKTPVQTIFNLKPKFKNKINFSFQFKINPRQKFKSWNRIKNLFILSLRAIVLDRSKKDKTTFLLGLHFNSSKLIVFKCKLYLF